MLLNQRHLKVDSRVMVVVFGTTLCPPFCHSTVVPRFVFVDVFVKASGDNKWNRWFFVAFYVLGVLVILNVSAVTRWPECAEFTIGS